MKVDFVLFTTLTVITRGYQIMIITGKKEGKNYGMREPTQFNSKKFEVERETQHRL